MIPYFSARLPNANHWTDPCPTVCLSVSLPQTSLTMPCGPWSSSLVQWCLVILRQSTTRRYVFKSRCLPEVLWLWKRMNEREIVCGAGSQSF